MGDPVKREVLSLKKLITQNHWLSKTIKSLFVLLIFLSYLVVTRGPMFAITDFFNQQKYRCGGVGG